MRIAAYSFGRIEIDGSVFNRDVVLVGGRVLCPWWREAGGHVFAPSDLDALVDAGADVVVLGTGYFGRVRVPDETRRLFADIELVVEKTSDAVVAYNHLASEGRQVAAGFHLSC
jgi:hypothetical protein